MAQAGQKGTAKKPEEDTSPQTWESFVDPKVMFKPGVDMTKTITALMACLPKPCKVISVYRDDDIQFWSVSWHWEYIRMRLKEALALPISAKSSATIRSIYDGLEDNQPDPPSGYAPPAPQKVGVPYDKSPADKIMERYRSVMWAKGEFSKVLKAESAVIKEHDKWKLAVARINPPGTSKHGSGYAIDIKGAGKHQQIIEACRSLGSTYELDEGSHVHIEFQQGALIGKAPIATDRNDGKYGGWRHSEKSLGEKWHILIDRKPYGPYQLPQMEQFLREGRIFGTTLVARAGAQGWGKLSDDPALKALIPQAAPAKPGQTQPAAGAA